MSAYESIINALNNQLTIDKAIELTATKTMQFAKRQKTWFRNKNNRIKSPRKRNQS